MNWFTPRHTTPIGVDFNGRCLHAVQLEKTPSGWVVQAAVSLPRSQSSVLTAEDMRELVRLIKKGDFIGKDVVITVPGDILLTSILELPPRSSGAPIDQIALAEMTRMHQCSSGELEMACWNPPQPDRAGDTIPTMAAGCLRRDASLLIDTFEKHGLDVIALDTRPWALARACKERLVDEPGITAILELGWRSAQLVVMHAGSIAYERVFPEVSNVRLTKSVLENSKLAAKAINNAIGLISLNEPADKQAGLMVEGGAAKARAHFAALADEFQAPFAYLESQYPDAVVQKLVLTGQGAAIEGLKEYFAARFDIEVEVVPPSVLADFDQCKGADCDPASITALGAATHEGEHASACVNLIPKDQLAGKIQTRRVRRWAVACLVYVLMLGVVYAGGHLRWASGSDISDDETRGVTREIEDFNQKTEEIQREILALKIKIETHKAIGNQPDWSVLLAILSQVREDDIVLKRCQLDLVGRKPMATPVSPQAAAAENDKNKRFVLNVYGLGRSQTAVSQFILRMERSGLFKRVMLIKTSKKRFLSGKAVAFQLSCTLNSGSEVGQ